MTADAAGSVGGPLTGAALLADQEDLITKPLREDRSHSNEVTASQKRATAGRTGADQALVCCDTLLVLFVVTPLVIGHWHGTWFLQELYEGELPHWGALVLGAAIHVTFVLARSPLNAAFNTTYKTKIAIFKRQVASKLYVYLFSHGCSLHWRGVWFLFDTYVYQNATQSVWLVLAVTLFSTAILVALKSVRNLLVPPTIIVTDSKDFVFNFPTRFRTESEHKTWLYVLDCLFSVLVIGSLVVVVWRGVWIILDLVVFPKDPPKSALASLILGYGVVVLTFSLQPVMRYICARLQGFSRVLVADLFLFFSFIGTVNVWRSVWQLLDLYFLPEHRIASDWITHAGCLFILLVLNCGNSVLVRGVYVDAEENAGDCVVLPVQYLRYYLQRERDRKSRRKAATETLLQSQQQTKLMEQGIANSKQNAEENGDENATEESLLNKTSGPVVVIVTNNTKKQPACNK